MATTPVNSRDQLLQLLVPRVFGVGTNYIYLSITTQQFNYGADGIAQPTFSLITANLVGNLTGNITFTSTGIKANSINGTAGTAGTSVIFEKPTSNSIKVYPADMTGELATINANVVYQGVTYTATQVSIQKFYRNLEAKLTQNVKYYSTDSNGTGYVLLSTADQLLSNNAINLELYNGVVKLTDNITYTPTSASPTVQGGIRLWVSTSGILQYQETSTGSWTQDSINFNVTATRNNSAYSTTFSLNKNKGGSASIQTGTISLYRWDISDPSTNSHLPRTTSSYTWLTQTHVYSPSILYDAGGVIINDDAWYITPQPRPTSNANWRLWRITKSIQQDTTPDISNAINPQRLSSITWTTNYKITEVTTTSNEFVKTDLAVLYINAVPGSTLSVPLGSAGYTWSTRTLNTASTTLNGWQTTIPAAQTGLALYKFTVDLTANSTDTTTTVYWDKGIIQLVSVYGVSAINVELVNGSHNIPCDYQDTTSSRNFTNSGSKLFAYDGTTPLIAIAQTTNSASTFSNGQYVVETSYSLTSTTSVTISDTPKTFSVNLSQSAAGIPSYFTVGKTVRVYSTANPDYYMIGTISSYAGTLLNITVTIATASATFSSWTIVDNNAYDGVVGGTQTLITEQGAQGVSYSNLVSATFDKNATGSLLFTLRGKTYSGTLFTYLAKQTFAKAPTGNPGIVYYLVSDTNTVVKSTANVYTPTSITFSGRKNINGTVTAEAFWFSIFLNGSGTATTSSTSSQINYTYSIPAGTTKITASIYTANPSLGGIPVDTQGITVVTDGPKGDVGNSARRAYALVASASTPASSPSTFTTTNGDSLPPVNTWFSGITWTTTAPTTIAEGNTLYQSDGIYVTGANVTWGFPYISALKVGNLSAITVNTGDLYVSGSLKGGASAAAVTSTTGAGYYFNVGGTMRLGNPASDYLSWDGANLKINTKGVVTIGNATGSRMEWNGTGLNIYDTTGTAIISSGTVDWTVIKNIPQTIYTSAGVTWQVSGYSNTQIVSGTELKKLAGVSTGWDTGAYSLESFVAGASISFQASSAFNQLAVGLTKTQSSVYDTFSLIDYGWVCLSGSLAIYELGAAKTFTGITTYTTNTVLSIIYDNKDIRYYRDGVLARTVPGTYGSAFKFYASVTFYTPGAGVKNIRFLPNASVGADGTSGSNGTSGKDGSNGTAGQRGSVSVYVNALTATSWSDATANTYFTNYYGGTKVLNDTLTQYSTSASPNWATTKFWNSTNSNWLSVAQVINGNLLVKGTVSAEVLSANSIIASDITFKGKLETTSSATGARMEITNSTILVYDGLISTPRIKIGNLS